MIEVPYKMENVENSLQGYDQIYLHARMAAARKAQKRLHDSTENE